MTNKLDKSDQILLAHLQKDATLSLEKLSDASHLSIPSVQRRLKQLRKKGVIDREVAVINPDALDQRMSFVVTVELERESVDQLDAFRQTMRKEARVQQCYYVTGEGDFVLICVAQDMQDFEDLTHTLFFNNSNVRRFRTSVIMDRTKVSLSVPIDIEV